jgi:hypothetical protein
MYMVRIREKRDDMYMVRIREKRDDMYMVRIREKRDDMDRNVRECCCISDMKPTCIVCCQRSVANVVMHVIKLFDTCRCC